MKILFNKKFLAHNPDSDMEGAYRLRAFVDHPDTTFDGEKYVPLVHTPSISTNSEERAA